MSLSLPTVGSALGAVLSDRSIKEEIAKGNIVLYDGDRDCSPQIQNCSVDVTLGENYFRMDKKPFMLNPWNANQVRSFWGNPLKAAAHPFARSVLNIDEDSKVIILSAGETILAHTNEFIGGTNHITTMLKARSSIARNNITICRDAGWGDIGYINRWTLEMTNYNDFPVVLPVGSRIGQIVFFYTTPSDKTYQGKYQFVSDLKELESKWTPDMLLPKAYEDNK